VKTLAELTHYEVLEVGSEAGRDELERAYRLARAAYSEDSLAVYSIFNEEDSSAIRERIELAYRVLADSDQRRAYDASLRSGAAEEDEIKIALDLDLEEAAPAHCLPELESRLADFDPFEEDDEGCIDGAWLRRSRLRCGVEIDEIALVTKINPTYLRFIEEEKFEDLPAPVYVRGFVGAYARCIGLDPERVVSGYMERLEEAPRPAARSRQRRGRW
jgi:flagellar biosynthesis protein FlhG